MVKFTAEELRAIMEKKHNVRNMSVIPHVPDGTDHAKRHRLIQPHSVDPTAVMQSSGDELADLRHEVNQLKQMVDSVVTEIWNMKMKQGSIKREPKTKKSQVVVDFGIVATLVCGVMIGVFVSLFWK